MMTCARQPYIAHARGGGTHDFGVHRLAALALGRVARLRGVHLRRRGGRVEGGGGDERADAQGSPEEMGGARPHGGQQLENVIFESNSGGLTKLIAVTGEETKRHVYQGILKTRKRISDGIADIRLSGDGGRIGRSRPVIDS
jgi:hypothetical protein